MLAVHLENGTVSVREEGRPVAPPGHALIRMIRAGICSTDLQLKRGYYGFSGRPGHEFVGRVEEAADARWTGKRVVGEINLACGQCAWCGRGLGRHCPNRTVLGIVRHPGAFAEFLTLPEANLREVPERVSDEQAVFAEPIAAACEILDQVDFEPGAEAAVLGDGKLGLLIAQALQLHGVQVHLYGRHAHKMAIVEPAGVKCTLMGGAAPPQFAYVVEATGSERGLETAIRMTQPRGTLILKSTVSSKVTLDTAPMVVNEIHVIGSRCGRLEPALEMLARGELILDPLIQESHPLAEANLAFERAAAKGALKVLLRG